MFSPTNTSHFNLRMLTMFRSNPATEDDLVSSVESVKNSTITNQILNGGGKILEDFGESVSILKHSLGWTIGLICAYVTIFIVGVIGNGMVVLVMLLRSEMKTVTNMFILNLAVADLLVIIFCAAPTLLTNILIPWVLGSFMCKTVIYIQGVSVCASVYSLVAISLDRFVAVWFPTKMPRGLSKTQARIIIIGIWILAATIISPWAIVFTLEEKHGYYYCVESWSSPLASKLYFILGNLVLCYTFPLALVMLENGLIWIRVANRKLPQTASIAAMMRIHKKTKVAVSRICIVVTLTLFISWLPLYVIFIISKMSNSLPEIMENMIPFAQILGINNSALNPILYNLFNRKFRNAFASLMACPRLLNSNNIQINSTVNSLNASPIPQTVFCRQSENNLKYPVVKV